MSSDSTGDKNTGASPMSGKRVYLRPIVAEDRAFLSYLSSEPESGSVWLWRGVPHGDIESLFPNSLAQFIVTAKQDHEPLALIAAVRGDLLGRTCVVNYVARKEVHRTGTHLEGTALFFNYLFRVWNMRKIYGEAFGHNVHVWQPAVDRGIAKIEGCFRAHVFLDGEYRDFVTIAIYREDWERSGPLLVERLTGTDGGFI